MLGPVFANWTGGGFIKLADWHWDGVLTGSSPNVTPRVGGSQGLAARCLHDLAAVALTSNPKVAHPNNLTSLHSPPGVAMAFLFRGGQKKQSPAEIVRSLKELLRKLWEPGKASPAVEDEIQKATSAMKAIVQGSPGMCRSMRSYRHFSLQYRGRLQS